MAVGGIGLIESLKTRMQWHQSRQKVLAENVSNADTPRFKPHDLKAPTPRGQATSSVELARTSSGHMSLSGKNGGFDTTNPRRFEVTPSGNGVNLEDEMLKVAQNQSDYQLASSLYSKSLGLMKIAIGKGR
jgi:flagellar basal-body rod protein FlgB